MSGTWSGFSEEDIKKFQTSGVQMEDKINRPRKVVGVKRKSEHAVESNLPLQPQNTKPIQSAIPEDAKLKITAEKTDTLIVLPKPEVLNSVPKTANEIKENIIPENNSLTQEVTQNEKKVIDLDEFQVRQKRMEEQNRRRKELLAKALADRTKQTEEEAKRLRDIQNEFKKLDALLSNDVSILRHQIETASLEFMEAQKKYNKIEKEFLEAKLALHQKLEKKEMLTEHLCAIIEKNEERKAEKLSELMNRLVVGETVKEATFPVENSISNNSNTDDIVNCDNNIDNVAINTSNENSK